MSSQALSVFAPVETSTPGLDLNGCLDALESAIGNFAADYDCEEKLEALIESRRLAARALAQLPKRSGRTPEVTRALVLVGRLAGLGVQDRPLEVEDEAWLQALESREWPAVLGVMILTSGWQWAQAPLLGAVPDWLWGDYAAWLFTPPKTFCGCGDADRFAAHFLRHVEELARWVERNPGSPAVRAALESYLTAVDLLPLAVSKVPLKRHAEAHGRILAVVGGARRTMELPARSRDNRKLRVAFVGTDPASIPAYHSSLDTRRFEIFAYALGGVADRGGEPDGVALAAALSHLHSGQAQTCRQLPATLAEQVAELSELGPDIIVYAEELALSGGPLTRLAAQRLAPLQVAAAPIAVTTGLSTIDVLVVGETALTEKSPEQFTERLVVAPGSGQLWADSPAATVERGAARTALGIAKDTCVLMTAVRLIEITAERRAEWVDLLQRLPKTVLAIQVLHADAVADAGIKALGAAWDAQLTAAGVDPARGLILAAPVRSFAELQNVVTSADLYLDAAAFAEPALLGVPLALGLPVVTRPGNSLHTRAGAAVLKTLGLDELIARDTAQSYEIVAALAGDPARRGALAERLRTKLEQAPLCRDSLAAAEALGFVLDCAHEELLAQGVRKFRGASPLVLTTRAAVDPELTLRRGREFLAEGAPRMALAQAKLVLAKEPNHVAARVIAGRAYLAASEFSTAVHYLLAALQTSDDASVWYDLAVALRCDGQPQLALQALETSLRHDGSRADAWVMLFELAQAVNATDTAQEALAALRACAPNDPRLLELAVTIASTR